MADNTTAGAGVPNLANFDPQMPQRENTMQYMGQQGNNIFSLIGAFLNRHNFQRQQDFQQAMGMWKMSLPPEAGGIGMPVDHTKIMRLFKRAGIPIETNPEKLSGDMAATLSQFGGQARGVGAVGADPMTKGVMGVAPSGGAQMPRQGMPQGAPGSATGVGPMQAPEGAKPYMQRAVDLYNKMAQTGKWDPYEVMDAKLGVLAGRAQDIFNAKNSDALSQARFHEMVTNKKLGILQRGPNDPQSMKDLGALTTLNEIPREPLDQQMYDSLPDTKDPSKPNQLTKQEYMQKRLNFETGGLTDAEKAKMHQDALNQFQQDGLSYSEASTAADSVASGKPLPPELQKKMTTEMDNARRLALTPTLQAMGFVGQDLIKAQDALLAGAPLSSVIPPNLLSVAQQEMGARYNESKLRVLTAQKSLQEAEARTQAAIQKARTDAQQKQIDDAYRGFDTAMRHGTPEDQLAAAFRLAPLIGQTVKVEHHWFGKPDTFAGFETPGGKTGDQTPAISAPGQQAIDDLSGNRWSGAGPSSRNAPPSATAIEKQAALNQFLGGLTRTGAQPQTAPTTAETGTGNVTVDFGKGQKVSYKPDDMLQIEGQWVSIDDLRQAGWSDEDISDQIKQGGVKVIQSPVTGAAGAQ